MYTISLPHPPPLLQAPSDLLKERMRERQEKGLVEARKRCRSEKMAHCVGHVLVKGGVLDIEERKVTRGVHLRDVLAPLLFFETGAHALRCAAPFSALSREETDIPSTSACCGHCEAIFSVLRFAGSNGTLDAEAVRVEEDTLCERLLLGAFRSIACSLSLSLPLLKGTPKHSRKRTEAAPMCSRTRGFFC